jgi:cytochrome c
VSIIAAVGLGTALPVASAAFAQHAPSSELPGGWGNAVRGVFIYSAKCSKCHSERDSRTTATDMEKCWRDPKMMFNFVKRAMPADAPGSLKDQEVYALVAYLLTEGKIIKRSDVLNAKTLPNVVMPNREGVIPNWCPEISRSR